MLTDNQRAALIAFLQSIFPVLAIAGVVDFDANQISILMLCVNNGLTLLALMVPAKNPPVVH